VGPCVGRMCGCWVKVGRLLEPAALAATCDTVHRDPETGHACCVFDRTNAEYPDAATVGSLTDCLLGPRRCRKPESGAHATTRKWENPAGSPIRYHGDREQPEPELEWQ
jgi:hypothetical protein